MPVVERPGQRQSISAASAVNARGGFWYCTYQGGLNADLFIVLLKRMMRNRRKPVHLVVDGLPAHKTALVKAYVQSTNGMLTLHFLPGYAPDLNPDEAVWSHMKRTGVARAPLRKGERLTDKIEDQLAKIKKAPRLVRSFFKMPSVAYITDWWVISVRHVQSRVDAGDHPCIAVVEVPLLVGAYDCGDPQSERNGLLSISAPKVHMI
jgi:transposase